MRRVSVGLAASLVCAAATLLLGLPAAAQDSAAGGPIVYHQLQHDVSLPLWMMARAPHGGGGEEAKIIIPENTGIRGFETNVKDPVADNAEEAGRPEVATTALLNFDGISATNSFCGCAPPDTEGSVGATQFVQYVNTAYEVYNKSTGAKVLGPLTGNSIWSGFGTCGNNDDGDPIVTYDKVAGRWFFAQNVFVTPYTVCIAVSTTSDATGSYNRYSYSVGNTNFPDYPKWGVWPDSVNNAYFQSFNVFTNGISLTGAEACAADRANILAGNPAPNFVCFTTQGGTSTKIQSNILPADLDGTTLPPAGSNGYYLGIASQTGNLNIYQFHVDFSVTTNSTFSNPTLISTAAFNEICPSTLRNACIKQPSPGEVLEGLSDRLMYRLSYRNFSSAVPPYESLLVNHTVTPMTGSTANAAVRWYEIRSPGSSPTVFQQGTFQSKTTSYWMGSIAQDKLGDIALGFSATSNSTTAPLDPSVQYTGRVPTDKLGTMETVKAVVKGTGVQENTSNRWGDYSDMSVDPTDDCTMWYTQMYIKKTGSFNWNTRINSFKFANCS